MNSQDQPHQNFTGATFTGAQNFGAGGAAYANNVTGIGASGTEGIDKLRELVTGLVATLNEHHGSALELDEARWRAEELAEELEEDQPRADRVKKRWLRLEPLVPAFTAAGSVAAIASLINDLF